MKAVISQPMYFPWPGMIEQVMMADVYVDYPDVQFSKGSFVNRVQLKTARGPRWMAVPLRDLHLGQRIDEVAVDERRDWRREHREAFVQAYGGAPYLDDAVALFDSACEGEHENIGALSLQSLRAVCSYYGIDAGTRFASSHDLGVPGTGSRRVLDIVRTVGADVYVTGHGARHYLDHEAFVSAGISVQYMDYACTPYSQQHGEFTPYVSSLDLVANMGPSGIGYLRPRTRPWMEFLQK